MKKEIIKILEHYQFDPARGFDSPERHIESDDFENIANKIIKLINNSNCMADVSGCFSDKIKNYRKVHGSCDDCQVAKWDKKGYCEYFHKTKECKESSYIYIQ